MATDRDIVKDADAAYEIAWRGWADWLDEAHTDTLMYLGNQWEPRWKTFYKENARTVKVFNRLARIVDIISGYERRTRLVLKAAPVGFDDDQVSQHMSEVLMGDLTACDGYNQISEAFKWGPLITGRNYLELFMGVNNRLRIRRVMYNHILPDPTSIEADLSDADFMWHREMVTIKQAKRLLRGMRDSELEGLAGKMDNKFPGIPWALRNFSEKMLTYDRFWEKSGKQKTFVVHKATGQEQEWTGPKKRLGLLSPEFTIVERWIDEIKLHIIVGGELMSSTADPLGIGEYPYVPLVGCWHPDIDDDRLKLQGLVRRLRDPQREYNKRICQEIDLVESQVQTGWKVEEGAVVDDRSLYQAGQGKVIFVKENKIDRIEQLRPGDIPPGQLQMKSSIEKQLPEIAGINEEFMGTQEKDIPGVLARIRQGSAVTGLQGYFDGLRLAKRITGRKWMKASQSRYDEQQVSRIVGEQVAPEFFRADLVGYDCVLEEGLLTDTQREIYYAELLRLYEQTGGAQGSPIPVAALIEAAPISMKKKLMDQIKQNQQQQAQQRQLDMQAQKLIQEMQIAQIRTDNAQAQERIAAANENMAEAGLDRAKTAAEIEKLQVDNLVNAIKTVRELEQPATAAAGAGK